MSTRMPNSSKAIAYTCSHEGFGRMTVSPMSRKTARSGGLSVLIRGKPIAAGACGA